MTDLLIHKSAEEGRLLFSITESPLVVRGLSQLVQEVVVDLLSDVRLDLGRGSGLKQLLSQIPSNDDAAAFGAVSEAVRAVSKQVLARQQRSSALSKDERLRTLNVLAVTYNEATGWDIKLDLVSEAETQQFILLPEI